MPVMEILVRGDHLGVDADRRQAMFSLSRQHMRDQGRQCWAGIGRPTQL